jgi:plastocyanin
VVRQGVAASIEAQVRDGSGRPVADAVVYAVPAGGVVESKAGKTVAIEQLDREFVPYVSVIQVGTRVEFPNRDPIQHHVYSFSPAKTFEIKLYTGRSPEGILFDKPGVITIGCNIHDWMIGYILVVATPYFATVDAAGVARLRDLRPGATKCACGIRARKARRRECRPRSNPRGRRARRPSPSRSSRGRRATSRLSTAMRY